MTTRKQAIPKSKSIRRDENDTNSQSQNLLDGYIYQYLVKKKFYSSARLFRMENTSKDRDTLLQAFNNDDQPGSLLQMWWLTFWDTFYSRNNPNNLNQPLTNSLSNQFPSGAIEMIRAKAKKYIEDGRIPKHFLKLLGEEYNPFKTQLKHLTPNSEGLQSLKVPIIIIDDDDDDEDYLNFNPRELLKRLDEEPYDEAMRLYNSERGQNLLAAIDEEEKEGRRKSHIKMAAKKMKSTRKKEELIIDVISSY